MSYGAYQTGATAEFDGIYDTRYSEKSPNVPYIHSLLHRFQPKPRRWHARARWRRILVSTQLRTKEKHRLEWPIAKYFTQPRRIGLIFSITSPTDWEREARKISLSLPSKAVRFLPFGISSGIHRPRRLRTRRNSNPRNPKLSPRSRSTTRLFSSFTSTCSLANSSRSRFSTACRSHCWRGCESTRITRSSANLAYSTAVHRSCRVTAFARSSIWSTSLRYRLLSSGEITPPCGTPCFPVASSSSFKSHNTFSSSTRRATFSNTI